MATPVIQTTSPWQPIANQLSYAYGEARRLYDQGGPGYYPGPTYVGFAPQTQAALAQMQARAQAGSPLTRAAQGFARQTLAQARPSNPAFGYIEAGARGDMLGRNPYLDSIFDQAARRVRDQVNAQFGAAGRAGSGAHAEVTSRNLGELANSLYGQAYESERDRQVNAQSLPAQLGQQHAQNRFAAAQLAPALAAADYADADRLLGVGQAHEQQDLAALQDRVQRHNFAQAADAQRLAQFMALLNGTSAGFSTTQTTAPQGTAARNVLGGAAAGLELFEKLGLPKGLGAIGGGLLSLF
jgi:hypothetical protein